MTKIDTFSCNLYISKTNYLYMYNYLVIIK